MNIPVWKCKTCGCLWRDNLDDSVSLFDAQQKSCASCEPLPVRQACEIHWLKMTVANSGETAPAWQPLDSAPNGYDGKRFHYVLFRGRSRGRSFDGYAYVSGYMSHDREPVHNYAYKLDITEWCPLPSGEGPCTNGK